MNSETAKQLLARSKSDQCWSMLRDLHPDIKRIAEHGAESDRDWAIIRMVLLTVSGDLHLRAAGEEDDRLQRADSPLLDGAP